MNRLMLVVLLSFLSFYSHASNLEKQQNIEELMELMDMDATMDAMYSEVGNMMKGIAQQSGVNQENSHIADKYMKKIFSLMRAELSWAKMKIPMIQVYMKHYTDKELKDMLEFYRSDTGRSMMRKMPMMMKDMMPISQKMMGDLLPKMQVLSEEMKSELRKASEKL